MQIFQFDDCAFEFALDPKPVPFTRAKGDQDSLQDWFHKTAVPVLSAFTADKTGEGIYLVHAHGLFSADGTRQSVEGVEVLKHIRLTEALGKARWWHAILYSFEPRESILLRKQRNFIVYSPAVTFLRLPDALDLNAALAQIKSPALTELAKPGEHRVMSDYSLYPYVACDYYEDDAHRISNWWGARQVIRGLNLVQGRQTNDEKIAAGREFRKLKNKKAAFLHGGFGIHPDRDNEIIQGAAEAVSSAVEAMFVDEEKENDKQNIIGYWTQINERLKPPNAVKVVYIDDEMDKGWREAIHLAFTGKAMPQKGPTWLQTFRNSSKWKNTDEGMKELAGKILSYSPHLIITDLRLWGPGEPSRDVKKISGGMLIKHLKEMAPAVPILLVTASNKSWTVEQTLDLGVDAYWMKEGIGDHATPEASAAHTCKLVRLLRQLLGDEYQLLRKVQATIDEWNSPNWDVWWKDMTWPHVFAACGADLNITRVEGGAHKQMLEVLGDLIYSYRSYLRAVNIQAYGKAISDEQKRLWLNMIALRIGLVIEIVHRFDLLRPHFDVGKKRMATAGTIGGIGLRTGTTQMRGDWLGQALYERRNLSAHSDQAPRGHSTKVSDQETEITGLIAALFAWLSVKPNQSEVERRPDINDFFGNSPVRSDALIKELEGFLGNERLRVPPLVRPDDCQDCRNAMKML